MVLTLPLSQGRAGWAVVSHYSQEVDIGTVKTASTSPLQGPFTLLSSCVHFLPLLPPAALCDKTLPWFCSFGPSSTLYSQNQVFPQIYMEYIELLLLLSSILWHGGARDDLHDVSHFVHGE